MPPPTSTNSSKLLTLIAMVVVVASLYFGRTILVPLALAFVFAFLLTPIVSVIEKLRIGRTASVLIVLVLVFAGLATVTWLVTDQILEIGAQLPSYKTNIHTKMQALRNRKPNQFTKVANTVSDLSEELTDASETAANKEGNKKTGRSPLAVQITQPPSNTPEYLKSIVGPLGGILETSTIVIIFALFMLVKREDLRNRVIRLAGGSRLSLMTQALDDVSQRLGRYLLLQFLVNAGYGLLFGLSTYLIGVPHWLLWGVLAGLFRFIPYIGAPVAALLPMTLAMAVFPGWSQVGLVFGTYVIFELTLSNFIEPWLYGNHTGVSSLAILVAAIFWALLWGPVGLILSTPLTVCLLLMGRYVPELAFLDILLGDEPVLSPPAHFYQRLLAMDSEEAWDIAHTYLKDKPLGDFYDSVLTPALGLAEKDRHANLLDQEQTAFVYQSARELVEHLSEDIETPSEQSTDLSSGIHGLIHGEVICIPARDEADAIVGTMLAQLLVRAGIQATHIPIGTVSEMLQAVSDQNARVICVSALPPSALGQARSLCKQLRRRFPDSQIILGLWKFDGGIAAALERIGPNCTNMVGTTLEQVVGLIRQLATSVDSPKQNDFAAQIVDQQEASEDVAIPK